MSPPDDPPSGSIPTPSFERPSGDGTPQSGAVHDVSAYGYTENEYFLTGDARPLGPANPFPEDERETPPSDVAPYTTRMLVYRPRDAAAANGTVLVEWPNVSLGRDTPVVWINTFDHAMEAGYTVVIASAQKVGVDDSPTDHDLAHANPDRYGDLHHPGDAYAYDMFTQAISAIRGSSGPEPDPLDGLPVDRVLATGMSQSAQYLRYYVNNVHEDAGVVDGFLPFVTARTPETRDDLRDDLAPVLWVMSEDEAVRERRPDAGRFLLWEIPGTSHINYWLTAWSQAMAARDFEDEPPQWDEAVAGQYGEREDGTYGECGYNYFPMRYAYKAALDALDAWVRSGTRPARAGRIVRENGEVQTDEHGNARGGVRLPPIEVPIATYDARACDSRGRTERFDEETLAELYPTQEDYVTALREAAENAVASGFLLRADAEDLLARAEAASIGGDRTDG